MVRSYALLSRQVKNFVNAQCWEGCYVVSVEGLASICGNPGFVLGSAKRQTSKGKIALLLVLFL